MIDWGKRLRALRERRGECPETGKPLPEKVASITPTLTKTNPDSQVKSMNRNDPNWKREAKARGFMKAAMASGLNLNTAYACMQKLWG